MVLVLVLDVCAYINERANYGDIGDSRPTYQLRMNLIPLKVRKVLELTGVFNCKSATLISNHGKKEKLASLQLDWINKVETMPT